MILLFLAQLSLQKKSISITSDNMNIITDKSNDLPVFVEFWNPYCQHCQNFRPTWELFSDECDDNYLTADVNCIKQHYICEKFHIEAYPTIKLIHPSRNLEIDYINDLDLEDLRSFASTQLSNLNFVSLDKIDIPHEQAKTNFYVLYYANKNDQNFKI